MPRATSVLSEQAIPTDRMDLGAHRTVLIAGLTLLLSSALSCTENVHDRSSDLLGEYDFVYPSGHVEVLVLNADGTYEHLLFDPGTRRDSSSVHSSTDRWKYSGATFTFYSWADFCPTKMPSSPALPPRMNSGLSGSVWEAASGSHTSRIIVDREFGYMFEHIHTVPEKDIDV
jgi:hypothetical protein